MRKVIEVLRMKSLGLGIREIARSVGLAHSTVREYLQRAEAAGVSWPLPEGTHHGVIEKDLFPEDTVSKAKGRQEPDFKLIHKELKRKGVTLQLLWREYKEQYPDGYERSQFCYLYHHWEKGLDVVMRQNHRAGEKVFVDWAGQTVNIVDLATGEIRKAYVFLAVLGASNYTYAEAFLSMDLFSWISAHCNTLNFFGGVPKIIVPDNTKTGVTHHSFYEPDLNPTYHDMAVYFNTVIIPARPKKPRDKAKVEGGVEIAERSIMAPVRNRVFHSLGEFNQAIRQGLTKLNNDPFQKLEGCRRTAFETLDKPALSPLPDRPYEYTVSSRARVNIDYHIEVDHGYYSVPYQLIRKEVDVRLAANTVEILFNGQRVAAHKRCHVKGKFVTEPSHRPPNHDFYLEWTPARLISWGESMGSDVGAFVDGLIKSRPHPEQAFRSCMGIMQLGRKYSKERLNAACVRALAVGDISYSRVSFILKKDLDQKPVEETSVQPAPVLHVNLRGSDYYGKKEVSKC